MFLVLKINILTEFLRFIQRTKTGLFLNKNLLNYNDHQPTIDFLHSLASDYFIPYILHRNKINSHLKTLIDNIFSNFVSRNDIW